MPRLTSADILQIKKWICEKKQKIRELEASEPTTENRMKLIRLTEDVKKSADTAKQIRSLNNQIRDLEQTLKQWRGNYPYVD